VYKTNCIRGKGQYKAKNEYIYRGLPQSVKGCDELLTDLNMEGGGFMETVQIASNCHFSHLEV